MKDRESVNGGMWRKCRAVEEMKWRKEGNGRVVEREKEEENRKIK